MSITVRLWSDKDLQQIGKDMFLTTVLMNCSSLGEKEIKHYPYHLRKEYSAMIGNDDITFYATDIKNAKKFIKAEYNIDKYPLEELREITYHSPQEVAGLKDKLQACEQIRLELIKSRAEIVELKDKLNKSLLISDHEKILKATHKVYKDKIARRNTLITDLRGQIHKQTQKILARNTEIANLQAEYQRLKDTQELENN